MVYTNLYFSGDKVDRKSTSGGIILMWKSLICWISKNQTCIATSTLEAEYKSTSESVKKMLSLMNIIKEILNKKLNIIIKQVNI